MCQTEKVACSHVHLIWEYLGWAKCADCLQLIKVDFYGMDSNLPRPFFRVSNPGKH